MIRRTNQSLKIKEKINGQRISKSKSLNVLDLMLMSSLRNGLERKRQKLNLILKLSQGNEISNMIQAVKPVNKAKNQKICLLTHTLLI